jgi:hypothetical protein
MVPSPKNKIHELCKYENVEAFVSTAAVVTSFLTEDVLCGFYISTNLNNIISFRNLRYRKNEFLWEENSDSGTRP